MLTRRQFLTYGSAGVAAVALHGKMNPLFAQAAEASAAADLNDHVLVIVELNGGNDGLNTLIPFGDDLYYKNRPTIAVPTDQVHQLNDYVGLHPEMGGMKELFDAGQLAVIQGAGYPEPDRSHFRSMEIWHTADPRPAVPPAGWLGRFLDSTAPETDPGMPRGLALTYGLPQALTAEQTVVPVVTQLDNLVATGDDAPPRSKLVRKLSTTPGGDSQALDFMRRQAETVYRTAERLREATASYTSSVQYPGGELGPQMQRAAQIIAANLGVRVLFVSQSGYDTHSQQVYYHPGLVNELSNSLSAFQQDLTGLGVADKVMTVVFSEFGRRVDENGSQGTDHGAGSCMFVTGSKVKGGLYSEHPSLEQLGDGDLIHTIDFRRIYATLLDGWLGAPSAELLGGEFEAVPLI